MTINWTEGSNLRARLGAEGVRFVEHGASAVERLLPHIAVSSWEEADWETPRAHMTSQQRREVRIVFSFGLRGEGGRSVVGLVTRKHGRVRAGDSLRTIHNDEKLVCDRLAKLVSEIVSLDATRPRSLDAIRASLEESIVADHLQHELPSAVDLRVLLRELHQLSEETYENKQLSFGCLIPRDEPDSSQSCRHRFPEDYFNSRTAKRYKALSDGIHTAYVIGGLGQLESFIELRQEHVGGRHWFPAWMEPLAFETKERNALGVALTRQGDVLVMSAGTLRFSYRFGRWRFWSHHHLVEVLKTLARTRRVPVGRVRQVTDAVYRAALDVSFRRTGALFVILSAARRLGEIVRESDRIGHQARDPVHIALDNAVQSAPIHLLPRAVVADLAGIDGAVVLDAQGRVLAYGAVLEPAQQPQTQHSEGARTKAALAASNLGVAVKVSSDGDIAAFLNEEKVFQV